jgi:hypothetical protein
MANVFIQFTGRFSQMGLGPALIQRENIQEEDIRASFTLAVVLGVVFAIATILVAPLTEIFFKNESIGSVIRWLSLSFVLGGFSLTATSLLRREMRFKALALVEVSAFSLGNGAIAICCAALGFGVWSLVVGMLAQQAIMLVISFSIVVDPHAGAAHGREHLESDVSRIQQVTGTKGKSIPRFSQNFFCRWSGCQRDMRGNGSGGTRNCPRCLGRQVDRSHSSAANTRLRCANSLSHKCSSRVA